MSEGRATHAAAAPTRIVVQQLLQRDAPVFHGYPDEDPDDWLKSYERTAKYNRWDDVAKLANVVFSLACAALVWFENHEHHIDSWENFKHNFRQAFSVASRARTAEMQLNRRRQRPGETVRDYYEDVLRLCARTDSAMPDGRKLEHLMRGVRDEFFAPLASTPPTNPAGFYDVCRRVEKQLELRHLGAGKAASTFEHDSVSPGDIREIVRQLIKTELAALRDEIVATIKTELCAVSPSTADHTRAPCNGCGEDAPRRISHHEIQAVVRDEVLAAIGSPRRPVLEPATSFQ